MLCLNNIVAKDLRLFLQEEKVTIGGLVSMYNYISSETGGLIYNAKTLMRDIDKIVMETGTKIENMRYPVRVLNCLLYGLDIIPEEDSVFYKIDNDKAARFEVLYKEALAVKSYSRYPEILKTVVKGALSESFLAELIIEDAKDEKNENQEVLDRFRKWDMIYDHIFKNNPEYAHYLLETGECIQEYLKHVVLTHKEKDTVYSNMRIYKMIGEKIAK